jgi:UPF0716 protein FxsA
VPFATLIFFAVPVIEMLILIEVGSAIGTLPTIGLVVLTAVVGVWLLRMEGLATINRVQHKLSQGIMPDTELLEGVMLIIGGALLLTPGFATDFCGFICLLPGLRRPLAAHIIETASFQRFHAHNQFGGPQPGAADPSNNSVGGQTIEGEFVADETSDKTGDASGRKEDASDKKIDG